MEIWKLVRLLLVLAGSGYLAFALYAPYLAPRLLYYPQIGSGRPPAGLRKIPGAVGELAALWLPNPGAAFTVWYFHGNAEDLGDIEPALQEFHDAGFSVFAVDYPGYGQSAGRPSEAALYAAARHGRNFLRQELKIPAERTILYGHSLGGGSATQLATEEKVAGLVLQGAFMSAYRVLTHWPLLPGDQYRNLAKIRSVRCPVLVVHGEADEVIAFHHGETLFAAAPEPKRNYWVPNAGHNDLRTVAGQQFWTTLSDFRALCARTIGLTP
jgi:fermentation-respiration switch protein FrsA (DUF1100 family)